MRTTNLAASLMLALGLSLTAAFGIAAVVNTNSSPSLMSRVDYTGESLAAEGRWRLALAACRELGDTERAVCRAKAAGDRRIAAASLEASYRGTIAAREHVRAVEARAAHSISEARRLVAPI
jgi:hypothetical protein